MAMVRLARRDPPPEASRSGCRCRCYLLQRWWSTRGCGGMRQPRVASCAGISAAGTTTRPPRANYYCSPFLLPCARDACVYRWDFARLAVRRPARAKCVCVCVCVTCQRREEGRVRQVLISGPGPGPGPGLGFCGAACRVAVWLITTYTSRRDKTARRRRRRRGSRRGRPVRHPYRMATDRGCCE